jgi:aminoglycoside phosphotransferase family enzyme
VNETADVSSLIGSGDMLEPSLAEKLRFLSAPASYAFGPASVETVETHMSYVFLAGARAYKLKKPVRYPFLDFSTLEAREEDCRAEAQLNRRLAPDVYRGVVALTTEEGRLALGGGGAVVDWLVEMRRLPRDLMLDRLIAQGGPSDAQLGEICDALARFYRGADRTFLTASDYVARFVAEQRLNRAVLTRPDFASRDQAARLLDALDARLAVARGRLEARLLEGHVVDGHGDLRPEHICLNHPVVIFDCLEFNAALRQVDPFDEIALLGVECAQLGAPALLRRFTEALAERLGAPPPYDLVALYGAWRAALRARLSFAHLLEPAPRHPQKWTPLARRYLSIAERLLAQDF